jgi:hypothetical protein
MARFRTSHNLGNHAKLPSKALKRVVVETQSFTPRACSGAGYRGAGHPVQKLDGRRRYIDGLNDEPTERSPVRSAEVKSPAPSSQRLLSIEDFAASVGISVWTVRGWAYRGRLASVKLGARLMSNDRARPANQREPATCHWPDSARGDVHGVSSRASHPLPLLVRRPAPNPSGVGRTITQECPD